MNKTERIARIYAAWLLMYSEAPVDDFDDAAGAIIELLLTGTGLEVWHIMKRWEDCRDL